jgi:hypothetical protein
MAKNTRTIPVSLHLGTLEAAAAVYAARSEARTQAIRLAALPVAREGNREPIHARFLELTVRNVTLP